MRGSALARRGGVLRVRARHAGVGSESAAAGCVRRARVEAERNAGSTSRHAVDPHAARRNATVTAGTLSRMGANPSVSYGASAAVTQNLSPSPLPGPAPSLLCLDVARGITIAFMIMVNNNGGSGVVGFHEPRPWNSAAAMDTVPGAGLPGRDVPFMDVRQNLAWLDRQLFPIVCIATSLTTTCAIRKGCSATFRRLAPR